MTPRKRALREVLWWVEIWVGMVWVMICTDIPLLIWGLTPPLWWVLGSSFVLGAWLASRVIMPIISYRRIMNP